MSAGRNAGAKDAFEALFHSDLGKCRTRGCDRRPARGSQFCGCCQEDRAENRVVLFRGGEVLPPVQELEKRRARAPRDMGYKKPNNELRM